MYNERLLIEWILGGRVEERADANLTGIPPAIKTGGSGQRLAIRAAPLPGNTSILWCAPPDRGAAGDSGANSASASTPTPSEPNTIARGRRVQTGYALPSWLTTQNALVSRGVGRDVKAKLHGSDDARLGAISSDHMGADARYRRWHRQSCTACGPK